MNAAVAFQTLLLPLVPLVPLLILGALLFRRLSALALRLAPWAPLPGLIASLMPESGAVLELPWMLLGGSLGLDATGRVFLFLFSLLWLAAGSYASAYLRDDPRRRRFFAFFLLALCGNLGLPIARDMLDFYLFFALMSFSAYGLVVHDSSDFALRAGRIYLYLVLVGEVMLFVALALTARAAGSLAMAEAAAALAEAPDRGLILALLLIGFGIKMGVVPLHVWLPLAHPAAPIPASAVLSGAMIKAGLLGLLRFLPLGETALPGWSLILITLGLTMAFYGVVAGLAQQQAKAVLAYSSISQMGFPLLGLGLALADPESWQVLAPVVILYALHHGLAKGTLFLGVGMAGELAGTAARRYLVLAGLLLPALALAGAPLTSGALAKGALKPLVYLAPGGWGEALPWLLSLGAVGTTLLMARFLALLWPHAAARQFPRPAMWGSWGLLILAVLLSRGGGLPDLLGLSGPPGFAYGLWDALWPVAVGGLAAAAAWLRLPHRGREAAPLLPPGDLLVLLHKLMDPLARLAHRLHIDLLPRKLSWRPPPRFHWHNLAVLLALHEAEQSLRRLPVAGALFLIVLILLLVL
ncbi:proton-conducting transporter membrane subunit [Geoalkalibacter halelectricus]|uniref:proton-conducting transporter transmembrane domain-containing protein n=1 Tax=Geoalkalibacter halelectricus TaxID=2847045 RepID=UPI003D22A55A